MSSEQTNETAQTNETGRLEAFSDGVFAIAITLLVLELKEPADDSRGLWHGLVHEWPQFTAYLLSFSVIGIMWMNHHSMFGNIVRSDRVLLLLNLLLLLWTSLLPFPTMLVSRHLSGGDADASTAVAVYGANLTLAAIAFSAMWFHAVRAKLLNVPMTPAEQRASIGRFSVGTLVYAATIAIAFISPIAALVIQFMVAGYDLFEQVVGGSQSSD